MSCKEMLLHSPKSLKQLAERSVVRFRQSG